MKEGFDMVDFGSRLRQLRRQEHITQQQLAQRLGLTKSVISAYETDLRMPSYDVLLSIARIFKVSTDYLLGCNTKNDNSLDLTGLTESQQQALRQLVVAMRQR